MSWRGNFTLVSVKETNGNYDVTKAKEMYAEEGNNQQYWVKSTGQETEWTKT